MADKLTIRINVEANRTLSKFQVAETAPVAIHNDANAQLNVKFTGKSPLCSASSPQLTISIAPSQKRELKVCAGTGGLSYRYTATVGTGTAAAAAEHQVLVVPRTTGTGGITEPIFFPETIYGFVAGVIITWSIFFIIGRKKSAHMQR